MTDRFAPPLSRAFPSQINVDLTEFCNLACIHCPFETVIKPKGKARRNLSRDHHRALIDDIVAHGRGHCRFVRYTGEGEPLLHPHLTEILADAAGRGGVPVALTSNGLLLTETRAAELLEAGVGVFDISLDALTQDTYGRIRVGGVLEQAVANTRALIELAHARGTPAKVMVSFVRQPLNEAEAQGFQDFWNSQGADAVLMRPRHSCAASVPDIAAAMWQTAPTPRTPCLYPWERLVVKPDGAISYCPADWKHEAVVGHMEEGGILAAWNGPRLEAVRRAHEDKDFAAHPFCGKCPDWSIIRWPDQGWGYAKVMQDVTGRKES